MPLAYLAYVFIAGIGLFLVPGMVLTRLAAGRRFDSAFFAVSLGVGTCTVCYLGLLVTGLLGLLFRFHISLALLAGIAVVITIAGSIAIKEIEGDLRFLKEAFVDRIRTNLCWPLIVFLATVFIVYLLGYDSTLFDQERCVSRAGILPFFDYLSQDPPLGFAGCLECFQDRNAFFLWNGGQRMGPPVFVSGFMAVFGIPGFRILHAFFGLLAAWFGWHLGRSQFGQPWHGYLTAGLLVFNPWALSIPLLDENIMGLALGTALFFFLFQRHTQWLFAGLFLGLFLGIRHVAILSIPAVLAAAWFNTAKQHYRAKWVDEMFGKGRPANISVLAISTILFSIPWVIVHTQAWLAGRELYESFVSMPETPHSFLGITFPIRGLLSWPFVTAPVRSPYNGYPTLLAFPLAILQTWGILPLAVAAAAVGVGWRKYRGLVVTGVLWLVPQMALLMVMANWVQPNKMGVFLCFSQPIVLAITAGAAHLATLFGGRHATIAQRLGPMARPAAAMGAAAVAMVALQLSVANYEADLDKRNFRARVDYIIDDYPVTPPMIRETEAALAQRDRERLAELALLPAFSMARHLYLRHLLRLRFEQIIKDFGKPRFRDYCERPKDLIHGLLGITPPLSNLPGAKDCPDLRAGPLPTLADMMHHPVSSIRDEAGGEYRGCFEPAESPVALVAVTIDLARPPVVDEHFISVAGPEPGASEASNGKLMVASNIPVPWADGGTCHLAIVPVWHDYYWVVIWYGDFLFEHLADRADVVQLRSRTSLQYVVKFPEGAVLRITEVSSLEPTRFHIWTTQVGESMAPFGPVPSSY